MSVLATRPAPAATMPQAPASLEAAGRVRSTLKLAAGLLVALVALAAVVRLPLLAAGYWGDETTCIGIAAHPLTQIPHFLRLDAAPPLYYVLLHGWMQVFGEAPVATHALSLIFALLCIPAAWWAAEVCFGRPAGWAAALLAATLPYLVSYSAETRMYSLVVLIAIVSSACFTKMLQGGGRRWMVAAVASSAAGLYTHNWFGFLLAAEVIIGGLVAARAGDRFLATRVLRFAMVAALLYLPWLPTLWFQICHGGSPWLGPPPPSALILTPLEGAGGRLWPLLAAAGALALVPLRWLATSSGRARPPTAAAIGWVGAVTVGVAWLTGQVISSWDTRYLGVAMAPLLLFVASRLGASRAGRVAVGVVAACFLAASVVATRVDSPVLDSKTNAASLLPPFAADLHRGDVVITEDQSSLPTAGYYLRRTRGVRFAGPLGVVADPMVWDGTDPTERMRRADPAAVVRDVVAGLRPGAHVLFVGYPQGAVQLAPNGYARYLTTAEIGVVQAVRLDPRLRLVGARGPARGVPSEIPMVAELYTAP